MRLAASAPPLPMPGSAVPGGHGRSEDHSDAQAAWHALDEPQALALLGVERSGLSSTEATRRLAAHGPNRLEANAGPGRLRLLWRQIADPLIYALLASSALAIAFGDLVDGAVVLAVVAVNALIGYAQEAKAADAIRSLDALVADRARVRRDDTEIEVRADDLVPGDVVRVEAGDKVPADTRLLEVAALTVDEAPLTGESVPVAKTPAAVDADAAVADRRNMLHSGTLVTAGTATGVVVTTGLGTEIGRVSSLLAATAEITTPLTRALAVLARRITLAIGIVAALLIVVGIVRGLDAGDAVLAGVTLAVAAVPEGLPAIVTIALAIGVRRMARRRAVIRRLPAVETLGATTVICTDKTGTLTANELTVQALWTPAGRYDLHHADDDALTADARALLEAGALCNDAAVTGAGEHATVSGEPTDAALAAAALAAGVDVEHARRVRPRLDVIPFDSQRGWMATAHPDDGGALVVLKGAPEAVLERCDDAPAILAAAAAAVQDLAHEGLRVLAVATHTGTAVPHPLVSDEPERAFTLAGLEAMIDPPRPEAVSAVAACRHAGLDVKMITGDHATTASTIARQVGLPEGDVLTGRDLDRLDDTQLDTAVATTSVFARVMPEHKLRIVAALRRRGQVVAMTGDGVNDAPALKQADIGVAMGRSGTSVAREAADVVLTDDNFASIKAAVEEGRRVYDNLVKALAFVLPTNLGEGLLILIAILAFPITGGEALLPASPVQILWINLVAAVTLALPLAFEAMEPGLMRRAPRPPDEPLLSRFVITRTVTVALLMTGAAIALFLLHRQDRLDAGASEALALAEAQTVVVTMIVLFQILYLVQSRTRERRLREIGWTTNPHVFAGVALLLALHASFVYLPIMHDLFGSAPLDAVAWAEATLAALIVLPAVAAEKAWRRRARTRPG
jgi:calcium-translocating P-type ATPase